MYFSVEISKSYIRLFAKEGFNGERKMANTIVRVVSLVALFFIIVALSDSILGIFGAVVWLPSFVGIVYFLDKGDRDNQSSPTTLQTEEKSKS
jgi:hypothetical protein